MTEKTTVGVSLGRVLLVGGNYDYISMYRQMGFTGTSSIEEADIVAFTGGEDVDPSMYGEMKLVKTNSNIERDKYEQAIYEAALARGIPMIGICRGGQFLNVMNEGMMWQDVNNHCRNHRAIVNKAACPWFRPSVKYGGQGNYVWVSSTHHQMMRPGPGAEILLTAFESRERHSAGKMEEGTPNEGMPIERHDIEALWYPKTSSLCFQPHPEFKMCPTTGLNFFQQCVNNLILKEMPLTAAIREVLETGVKK